MTFDSENVMPQATQMPCGTKHSRDETFVVGSPCEYLL